MSIRVDLHTSGQSDVRCFFINPDITYNKLRERVAALIDDNVEFCLKFWFSSGWDNEYSVVLGTEDELRVFLSLAPVCDGVLHLTVFKKYDSTRNTALDMSPWNGSTRAFGATQTSPSSTWSSTAGSPVPNYPVQPAKRARTGTTKKGTVSQFWHLSPESSLSAAKDSGLPPLLRFMDSSDYYMPSQTAALSDKTDVVHPDSTVPGNASAIIYGIEGPAIQVQNSFSLLDAQYGSGPAYFNYEPSKPSGASNWTDGSPGSMMRLKPPSRTVAPLVAQDTFGMNNPPPDLGPHATVGSPTGPTETADWTDVKNIKAVDLKPLPVKAEPIVEDHIHKGSHHGHTKWLSF